MKVIIYTKEHCPLCEDAKALLSLFHGEHPLEMEERDIYSNDEWLERYQLEIPVIEVGSRELNGEEISYESLERLLKEENEAGE
ncbi:glutaredoxin family protein [Virgibacillus sediminis]|uniref:Glutaredoxin family protein n=1 Tax=Virgibacillus sediminis TaxID=202260 RepID=A0ABV7A2N0_9BACI